MEQSKQYIEEDEIDLRELWQTIVKRKKIIFLVTTLITTMAVVYAYFKNPVPIYRGNVMIEVGVGVGVGDAKSQIYFDNVYFDNTNNLKSIVEQKFSVTAIVPKKTNNILIINADNIDKNKIKNSLNNVVSYVLEKHEKKLKLYDKYIMTKQIGEIKIGSEAVNKPKKKLIVTVAFVTGLILSIFLVFFLEFIRKDEDK